VSLDPETQSGHGFGRGDDPAKLAAKYAFQLLTTPEELHESVLAGPPLAPPSQQILREKPEHRLVIFMKATGASNAFIAEHSGFSEDYIRIILSQGWARQRLLKELETSGRASIQQVMSGEADDCVHVLKSIRDDPKVPANVRAQVANSMLDRAFGKATQQMQIEKGQDDTSQKSLDELAREVEALRAEQQGLIGRPMVREVQKSVPLTILNEPAAPKRLGDVA
jgi:hypothetical protein